MYGEVEKFAFEKERAAYEVETGWLSSFETLIGLGSLFVVVIEGVVEVIVSTFVVVKAGAGE